VRRTWGPTGQTPILRHSYRRDRLSVISSVTVTPRYRRLGLSARFHQRNITGEEVVEFLRQLLRQVPGPIDLLWDGGPIHRRRSVQEYLQQCAPRLVVHRFPAYAPELNPDEFVWTQSKQALANLAPRTARELQRHTRRAVRRIGRSQALLWACVAQSDLPWKVCIH